MIVCYGWTNTQLINLVNVRLNSYQQDEADLIILKLDRISERLVESIKNSEIFNRVICIPPPTPPNSSSFGKIPLIKNILYGKATKEYYFKTLATNLGNKYTKMLTAGYWAETIFLLRYFYQINPNIRVSFVEEGINGYYADKSWLCKTIINSGLKEKVIRILHFRWFSVNCNKLVDSIYLYEPKVRLEKNTSLIPLKLNQINAVNNVHLILENAVNGLDFSQYDKRDLYYLQTPSANSFENYNMSYEIINKIVDLIGKERIIIKLHPVTIEKDPDFAQKYESLVFVDRRNYLFEGMYAQVNLSEKIIVTSGSSAVMNPKFMFDKEPYLIFTHRLYDSYKKKGDFDSESDRCAEDLYKWYRDKSKIFVTNSFEELQEVITNIMGNHV